MKIYFDKATANQPPEIVTRIETGMDAYMRAEALEIENWLRRTCKPLIADGYRLEELHMFTSDTKWRHGNPLRILLPRKDIHPVILWLRRLKRKTIPYRMPDRKS